MKIPFVGRNGIMILQSITHLVILSCFFLAGRSGIFLFIWRTKSQNIQSSIQDDYRCFKQLCRLNRRTSTTLTLSLADASMNVQLKWRANACPWSLPTTLSSSIRDLKFYVGLILICVLLVVEELAQIGFVADQNHGNIGRVFDAENLLAKLLKVVECRLRCDRVDEYKALAVFHVQVSHCCELFLLACF